MSFSGKSRQLDTAAAFLGRYTPGSCAPLELPLLTRRRVLGSATAHGKGALNTTGVPSILGETRLPDRLSNLPDLLLSRCEDEDVTGAVLAG